MTKQDPAIGDTYFFLCSPDWPFSLENGEEAKTEDAPQKFRSTISEGEPAVVEWSCGNTKKIEVGNRAYLLRSGSNPTASLQQVKLLQLLRMTNSEIDLPAAIQT